MSDLISRQAAIDAIMGEPTDAHYPSWYAVRLEQLPSAQPEPCEDAVSREAVLDKAWDAPYEGRYIQVVSVGDIEELPPVTPSHKKGKWVKVTNGRGGHELINTDHIDAIYPELYAIFFTEGR